MKTRVEGFWEASLSPVLPYLRSLNLRNLLFSFLLGVLSVSFLTIFGTAMSRQSEGKCLRRSVNSSTPALSVSKLPQVLQQQETYKWTLSFYRHGPPCFKFGNNTSGRARLWDTALKFLAEAFSWHHQITWYDLDTHIILWTNSLALSPFSGHKKKKKTRKLLQLASRYLSQQIFILQIGSTCLCNVPTIHFMFAKIIIIITEIIAAVIACLHCLEDKTTLSW